ncbi:hypothetical protein A2U01_0078200, partial [Trifolium medium]|nr:hypothetical protein [Trifolium medium]
MASARESDGHFASSL